MFAAHSFSLTWGWSAPNQCNLLHPLQSKTPPRIVEGCNLAKSFISLDNKSWKNVQERFCQWRFKVNWTTSCHLIDFSLRRSTWPKCQDFPPFLLLQIHRRWLLWFCSFFFSGTSSLRTKMQISLIVTKRKETGCEDSNTGSAQELNLFIER